MELIGLTPEVRALLPERFWRRVRQDATCWLWTGGTFHFGHAAYWHDGQTRRASRVLWRLIHGSLLDGDDVLHTCDRPRCVYPAHLFLGDQAANVADMMAKGRQYRPIGDLHHNRILCEAQVAVIKAQLAAGAVGAGLARDFGVHPNTIYAIAAGRRWGHVAC